MFHHSGTVLEPARRRASLDASPRRSPVYTDTSKLCSELVEDFVIELEVRLHPDLTPVTSRRPALPPVLLCHRIVRPSMPPFPPEVNRFRCFFVIAWLFVLSAIQSSSR